MSKKLLALLCVAVLCGAPACKDGKKNGAKKPTKKVERQMKNGKKAMKNGKAKVKSTAKKTMPKKAKMSYDPEMSELPGDMKL